MEPTCQYVLHMMRSQSCLMSPIPRSTTGCAAGSVTYKEVQWRQMRTHLFSFLDTAWNIWVCTQVDRAARDIAQLPAIHTQLLFNAMVMQITCNTGTLHALAGHCIFTILCCSTLLLFRHKASAGEPSNNHTHLMVLPALPMIAPTWPCCRTMRAMPVGSLGGASCTRAPMQSMAASNAAQRCSCTSSVDITCRNHKQWILHG